MQTLTLPVEEVPSPLLRERNEDAFVNLQLASRLFETLDGSEFERALLLARGPRGAYERMKAAGKPPQGYARQVMEQVDPAAAERLLYLCRLSSYLGGPGFPDLLLPGHGLAFRYTSETLREEQIFFGVCARLWGFGDIKILQVIPAGQQPQQQRDVPVDLQAFLRGIVQGRRFAHYWEGIEEVLAREREKLRAAPAEESERLRDEVIYLEHQKAGMPFHLLKAWQDKGVRKEDLDALWELFQATDREPAVERALLALREDASFLQLPQGMDEPSLRTRLEYIVRKTSFGESRAMEVLKCL